jgi:hypothetical protein
LFLLSPPPEKESQPKVKAASARQLREAARHALAEAQAERDRTVVTPPGIPKQDVQERSLLLNGLVSQDAEMVEVK